MKRIAVAAAGQQRDPHIVVGQSAEGLGDVAADDECHRLLERLIVELIHCSPPAAYEARRASGRGVEGERAGRLEARRRVAQLANLFTDAAEGKLEDKALAVKVNARLPANLRSEPNSAA